jgi:hypothetical protein
VRIHAWSFDEDEEDGADDHGQRNEEQQRDDGRHGRREPPDRPQEPLHRDEQCVVDQVDRVAHPSDRRDPPVRQHAAERDASQGRVPQREDEPRREHVFEWRRGRGEPDEEERDGGEADEIPDPGRPGSFGPLGDVEVRQQPSEQEELDRGAEERVGREEAEHLRDDREYRDEEDPASADDPAPRTHEQREGGHEDVELHLDLEGPRDAVQGTVGAVVRTVQVPEAGDVVAESDGTAGKGCGNEQHGHGDQVGRLDPGDPTAQVPAQIHRVTARRSAPDEGQGEHEAAHHEEDQDADRSSTEDRGHRGETSGLARRPEGALDHARVRRQTERDGGVVREDEGDRDESQTVDLGDPASSRRSSRESRQERVTPALHARPVHETSDATVLLRPRQ